MQKRQQILIGVLGVLLVAFLLWTFVLKSDGGSNAVEAPTVTTVATGEVQTDPLNPAAPAVPGETGTEATPAAPVAPVERAVQRERVPQPVRAHRLVPDRATVRVSKRCGPVIRPASAIVRRLRARRSRVRGSPILESRAALPDGGRVPRSGPRGHRRRAARGLPILIDDIAAELARRRLGYGRGPRMRFEQDEVELLGGVRHGRTLGSPVAIVIRNSEWATGKWAEEMSSAPGATATPLTQPRPGHADLAGMQKYGFTDARDVLERASARETAARVAAGALAKALLAPPRHLGAEPRRAARRGDRVARRGGPGPTISTSVDSSEVRCFDPDAEAEMIREIKEAAKAGDSLGGVRRGARLRRAARARLARALGPPHRRAARAGADEHPGDEGGRDRRGLHGRRRARQRGARRDQRGTPSDGEYRRESSRAGGIEGGMTTGDLLVARVAMKPLATLNRPVLKTVDTETKEETVSFKERTDVTAVPAAGVVAETMVALGARVGGAAQVRRRLARRVRPQPRRLPRASLPSEHERRHLVLVGLMGAGKTTVGRALREAARPPVRRHRRPGRRARRDAGRRDLREPAASRAFRELEREVVVDVCASPAPLVDRVRRGHGGRRRQPAPPPRRRRRRVAARADRGARATRVGDGATRPLLAGDPDGRARAGSRRSAKPRTRPRPTSIVDTDGLDVDAVADAVLAAFAEAAVVTHRVHGRPRRPRLRRRRSATTRSTRWRDAAARPAPGRASSRRPIVDAHVGALVRAALDARRRRARDVHRWARARTPSRSRRSSDSAASSRSWGCCAATSSSRSAAASSATPPASRPRCTTAASTSCRCRPRCSRWSTARSAARPA